MVNPPALRRSVPPKATPAVSVPPTLTSGQKGPAVATLQQKLNRVGALPPLATDGHFGPKTHAAVEAFQKRHGLAVDGKVGVATTTALDAELAKRSTTDLVS
jgi:peptidoglycan hydrolase-like protein with peptidoglycan-binding domain